MESCEVLTNSGYQCANKSKYCINEEGLKINFCGVHKHQVVNHYVDKEMRKAKPDYFYDSTSNKFIVNKISRVPHDPLTNLPTRYTEGLTDKQKLKYKKEIEETQKYYKETGLVKGRSPVSRSISPSKSHHIEEFNRRYGFSISDEDHLRKTFPDTDIEGILRKGRAAYASGSRPTVSGSGGPEQWARARLASVLTGGKALAVDKDLVGPKSLKRIFK